MMHWHRISCASKLTARCCRDLKIMQSILRQISLGDLAHLHYVAAVAEILVRFLRSRHALISLLSHVC